MRDVDNKLRSPTGLKCTNDVREFFQKLSMKDRERLIANIAILMTQGGVAEPNPNPEEPGVSRAAVDASRDVRSAG